MEAFKLILIKAGDSLSSNCADGKPGENVNAKYKHLDGGKIQNINTENKFINTGSATFVFPYVGCSLFLAIALCGAAAYWKF